MSLRCAGGFQCHLCGDKLSESVHKQGIEDQFFHVYQMTEVLSHFSAVLLFTEIDFAEATGGVQNTGDSHSL